MMGHVVGSELPNDGNVVVTLMMNCSMDLVSEKLSKSVGDSDQLVLKRFKNSCGHALGVPALVKSSS